MGKAVRKAEKAAANADKAQSKIPTKKVVKPELTADPKNGKIKVLDESIQHEVQNGKDLSEYFN